MIQQQAGPCLGGGLGGGGPQCGPKQGPLGGGGPKPGPGGPWWWCCIFFILIRVFSFYSNILFDIYMSVKIEILFKWL